jgi:hypothetical protein
MLGTSPARPFHLKAQGFPGPMQADGGIFRRNTRLLRQVTEGAVFQVDNPEGILVFRLERGEKAGHALADLLPQHLIGFLSLGELSAPFLQGARSGGPLTVMIDDGVAQDPIEPGHNLFILHTGPALQSAHKRRLQDFFGGGSGLDTPLEEGQKLAVSLHELRQRFG